MEESIQPDLMETEVVSGNLSTVYEVVISEEPEGSLPAPNEPAQPTNSLMEQSREGLPGADDAHHVIYEIIKSGSKRGTDILADNLGFLYCKKRENDVCVSWICRKRTKLKCGATVRQCGTTFTRTAREHVHPGNQADASRCKVIRRVQEAAMQDLTTSAIHLVSGILRHLTPADMGTLRADFLQRVANRARQPLRQKQPHPGDSFDTSPTQAASAGDTVTYTVTRGGTKRRAEQLTDSLGFTYWKNRKDATTEGVTWACTARHLRCRATVNQRADCFLRTGQDHNHPFGYKPLKQARREKGVKRRIRPVYSSDTSGSSTSLEDERPANRLSPWSGPVCCVCGPHYSRHPGAGLLPLPPDQAWRLDLALTLGWDRPAPLHDNTHICTRHFEDHCIQGGALVAGSLPTKDLTPDSPVSDGVVYQDLAGVAVAARESAGPWSVLCTDTEVQLALIENSSVKLLIRVNVQLQATIWVHGILHESRSIENTPLSRFLSRLEGRGVCRGVPYPELQPYASLPEPTLPYYRHVVNVPSPAGLTHTSTVRSTACKLLVVTNVCRPCREVETILKKKKHAQDKAEFFQTRQHCTETANSNEIR